MERCSCACTQVLLLDRYTALKILQSKNKLKLVKDFPQLTPRKLYLNAIKKFLSAREGRG